MAVPISQQADASAAPNSAVEPGTVPEQQLMRPLVFSCLSGHLSFDLAKSCQQMLHARRGTELTAAHSEVTRSMQQQPALACVWPVSSCRSAGQTGLRWELRMGALAKAAVPIVIC